MNRQITPPRKVRSREEWETRREPYWLPKVFPKRLVRDLETLPRPNQFPDLDIENGQGYFIHGDVGTGKTVYACQLAVELQALWWMEYTHKEIMFINTADLFDQIKASFGPGAETTELEIKQQYQETDLLLLDDLGLGGKVTDWFLNTLYSIINHRYDNLLPTIITSNEDLAGLDELFRDSRITSRIQRMCKIGRKTPYEKP